MVLRGAPIINGGIYKNNINDIFFLKDILEVLDLDLVILVLAIFFFIYQDNTVLGAPKNKGRNLQHNNNNNNNNGCSTSFCEIFRSCSTKDSSKMRWLIQEPSAESYI